MGGRDEAWPAVGLPAQVGDDHRCAGAEAVQAGPFVVLQLEEFQQAHLFVGGGHDAEFAVAVREQHAYGARAEHAHTAVGQQAQEVDQVEVGDQVVRQLDKGLGQESLIHRAHPSVETDPGPDEGTGRATRVFVRFLRSVPWLGFFVRFLVRLLGSAKVPGLIVGPIRFRAWGA